MVLLLYLPTEDRMPASHSLTPAQASYVLERLIAERRISLADVRGYLAAMGSEIADIERRLATLREAASHSAAATIPTPRSAVAAPRKPTRKRRPTKGAGHPRGIAGTLAVLLRSIPAAEHAAIAAIRSNKGIKAAIIAARRAVPKAS